MSLLKQIDEDLIKALKGGDKEKTLTLRGLKSDIRYYTIDKKIKDASDDDVIAVLSRAAKKRRDSIEQFKLGKRDDLVAKESNELSIIEAYLPAKMSAEDLEQIIKDTIAEVGAETTSQMGLVMKAVMPKVAGQADGKEIKDIVTKLLAG